MQTTFLSLPPEFTEVLRTGSRLQVRIASMKATILLTLYATFQPEWARVEALVIPM